MEGYVDVTIRLHEGGLFDQTASLNALLKTIPWLEIKSVKIVPLEPCECGGHKREGALMCDECAGAVIG